MNNIEKYSAVFCKVFNIEPEYLGPAFTFKDTPIWDSMAHMSLISELEDEFDVMFETDDILHYGSYENGIAILKRYGVEF